MPEFKFTKKAVKDLSNIWNYTLETWSEKQADKYYNQIIKKCTFLSKKPESGTIYFAVIENLRSTKINKHLIFYRIIDVDTIEIERILHERMDIVKRLKE